MVVCKILVLNDSWYIAWVYMVANYKKCGERFSFSKILWPNKTSGFIQNTKKAASCRCLTKVAIQQEVGAGGNLA